MRPVNKRSIFNFFHNSGPHSFKMRAGHANGIALFDAGGEYNGFSASVFQHLCASDSSFARAAATTDEAYHLACSEFFKSQFPFGGTFEIRCSGA